MKTFDPTPKLKPDFKKEAQFTTVEAIIPNIKPPLPLEPKELYRPIHPADTAAEVLSVMLENNSLKEFFLPFKGQIVVEIGPGERITGYEIALLSGAHAYVAVDPYNFIDNLQKFLKEAEHFTVSIPSSQISRTAVKADALSFLRRLPDKSVSIFASELESVMEEGYQIEVEKQMERVLHPQGAFIEYHSDFKLDGNLFKFGRFKEDSIDTDSFLLLTSDLKKYQLKS